MLGVIWSLLFVTLRAQNAQDFGRWNLDLAVTEISLNAMIMFLLFDEASRQILLFVLYLKAKFIVFMQLAVVLGNEFELYSHINIVKSILSIKALRADILCAE